MPEVSLPKNFYPDGFTPEVDDDVYDQKPKHPLLRHVLWEALKQAKDWSHLPENRQEAWAAAANALGAAPEGDNEVSRFLKSQEGEAARRDFAYAGPLPGIVTRYLSGSSQEKRLAEFQEAIPEAYGMLLEGFGEKEGLKKMGREPLPQWAYAKVPHPNPLPYTPFSAVRWTKDDLNLLRGMRIETQGLAVDQPVRGGHTR
ncbi:MAG: hypothetical protein PW734_09390 [Verrucomicrobium sp.]|nr:hypothetical protein [Verrucomicrobium sp.]